MQVALEIEVEAWGEDCTIGQLFKQAAESAISEVRLMVKSSPRRAKILDDPKVLGIITSNY